jgi:hypothetical protein
MMMNNDEKRLKELKKERTKLSKIEKYYDEKSNKYSSLSYAQNDKIIKINNEIEKLSHKYSKGDLVIIRAGFSDGTDYFSIAQITKLVGAKRYDVFEYFPNGRLGTHQKFLEDKIVCTAKQLFYFFEIKKKEM